MLWSAFTIGLVSSLHCLGMCGPIAASLPTNGSNQFENYKRLLIYNLGRILAYSVIGVVFGALGLGIFFSGLQQKVSLILGLIILVMAFYSFGFEKKFEQLPLFGYLIRRLKMALSRLLQSPQIKSFLLIGFLNGFLPCGMVYLAAAGAVVMGTMSGGIAYMILFGLGTVPMMIFASQAKNLVRLSWRTKIRKLSPIAYFLIAFILIFRGLSPGLASMAF